MTDGADPAARAVWAARLICIDPAGLGGLWLRARAGPARDRVLDWLAPLAAVRLHPAMEDAALFGGLDLTATLAEGRPVERWGILEGARAARLAMAERCPIGLAARLAQARDAGGPVLILADEGAEPDETPPPALIDRAGLFVSLDGVRLSALPADLGRPARELSATTVPQDLRDEMVGVAAALGIGSLRAPAHAIAAARAVAAWRGHAVAEAEDAALAVALTLAHRAEAPPAPPPEEADEAPPPPDDGGTEARDRDREPSVPDDMLLKAAAAALPAGLLAALVAGRAARQIGGTGAGAARTGNRRGRPLPSRAGRPDGRARIDLVATLRAAAPWQPLRRADASAPRAVHVRASDLRMKRFEEMSDRLLVFAVDASGSAAAARLAEAKGAVEILLAEAYARRDHVALVAFRGRTADLVLPPTRSLVQTKRRLAALPGGGGTPLAAGLDLAAEVVRQARRRGMSPALALLTDGRANIARDGTADRARAAEDALSAGRMLRAEGVPALVLDTGRRPAAALSDLALALGGRYLPLPRADAGKVVAAVDAALGP
ncbi:magnesium chelatase subunit D [Rhodobacteraceae bacterium CCMM004]|nr:magnesium chelatase subunit D [Rhodobacteraceae bacterium CCMM004]